MMRQTVAFRRRLFLCYLVLGQVIRVLEGVNKSLSVKLCAWTICSVAVRLRYFRMKPRLGK